MGLGTVGPPDSQGLQGGTFFLGLAGLRKLHVMGTLRHSSSQGTIGQDENGNKGLDVHEWMQGLRWSSQVVDPNKCPWIEGFRVQGLGISFESCASCGRKHSKPALA